jgi:hypothetical protein
VRQHFLALTGISRYLVVIFNACASSVSQGNLFILYLRLSPLFLTISPLHYFYLLPLLLTYSFFYPSNFPYYHHTLSRSLRLTGLWRPLWAAAATSYSFSPCFSFVTYPNSVPHTTWPLSLDILPKPLGYDPSAWYRRGVRTSRSASILRLGRRHVKFCLAVKLRAGEPFSR